ncbi:MAG TPA: NAD(P)H-quinone oxidoreductase [Thermoanaerobaculia bacterium]|nr:NAD(P)H-quinone oxidoreductase [Thermoanaerobaculia bacterium]
MKAILIEHPGDESVMRLGESADPEPGSREVRIRVRAAGVNRADLLQREGKYPPPAGASPILGLECAGVVEAVGSEVHEIDRGDRVMALLSGGGYAEYAVAHAGSVIRTPGIYTDVEAGAFPETFLTAFLNLFILGGATEGQTVLVHGGGSGVGTSAIQLCRAERIRVIVTAGSAEKCRRCLELGADAAIDYRKETFEERVKELTNGRGVDVVLDHIGASYLDRNLATLATGGRLVVIGGMGGTRADLDLGRMLSRRLSVIGSTLRSRSEGEKREIVRAFLGRFGEAMRTRKIAPVIDSTFPLEAAAEAHRRMAAGEHFGKIVLVGG